MRVAVIQFCPIFKGPGPNLQVGEGMVRAAAANGAQLIVLPELSTTGYSFMNESEARPFAEDLSEGGASPSKDAYTKLARDLNVAIAWGLVTVSPGTNDLYNSQVLVLPSGNYIRYDKVNPWGNDFLWATNGKASPPIIEYLGKKVGLLICRDVRDTATGFKDFYEAGDADIVAFSANWGAGGFPSGAWVDFSTENKAWLLVSNRYGREVHNDFGHGGICVVSPEGKVHCDGLLWDRACIVYADIP